MPGRRKRQRRRADLSQHFLRSRALAADLVAQAPVGRNDLVIEIGPGRGILTRELAGRARETRAVELDGALYRRLRTHYDDDPRVSLVHADFLEYRLPRGEPYKVVGNIPFSRTTAIVEHLVRAFNPPDDVFIIVQREAAERFSGTPFATECEVSLLLKPWWQVEIVRRMARRDFDPPPSVDCVVLHLARRFRPLVDEHESAAYRRFVSRSFGRTGNSVSRCLRGVFTGRQVKRLGRDLRFDPDAPPSWLSFDQWLGLFRFFATTR